MQLHPSPYPIKLFSHHLGEKTLIVEASDLGWRAGEVKFSRLYDDACDDGIVVYNPRTNSTTYWHTAEELRDPAGDITAWVLRPTHESSRKHPGVQNYTMHILND